MCAGARVFERVSEASDGQAAERTGSDLADHAVRALETQTAVTTEQSGAGRTLHAGYTHHRPLIVCQEEQHRAESVILQ